MSHTKEFTPFAQGTAMQFAEDGSNLTRFVAFIGGGTLITNGKRVAVTSDGKTVLNRGDYAIKKPSGKIIKMYADDFRELFD